MSYFAKGHYIGEKRGGEVPAGEFYVHDVDCRYSIERYSINTECETVEKMENGSLVVIPDGSATPVGYSIKGRVYIGLANPWQGKFMAEEGDPYADIAEPSAAATEQ